MGIEKMRLLAPELVYWVNVSADIKILQNSVLHVLNTSKHSKFSVLKRTDGLLANDLLRVGKIVLTEFGLPKKTVSDAGTNFI